MVKIGLLLKHNRTTDGVMQGRIPERLAGQSADGQKTSGPLVKLRSPAMFSKRQLSKDMLGKGKGTNQRRELASWEEFTTCQITVQVKTEAQKVVSGRWAHTLTRTAYMCI